MKIIGIDPGLDGGITIMENGEIKEVHSMPIYSVTTKKKLKSGKYQIQRHIDAYTFADILFKHKDATIYMESVNPFAGMGSASSTRMAISIGRLEGAMAAMGFKWKQVTPKAWQKVLWISDDYIDRTKVDKTVNQSKTDTKKTSSNAASRIFPGYNFIPDGKRAPHDGWFDSALIAEFGNRSEK